MTITAAMKLHLLMPTIAALTQMIAIGKCATTTQLTKNTLGVCIEAHSLCFAKNPL
jgi:hypothetical protein